MTIFYKGVAGSRGYNPTKIVIHNDAGGKNATAAFYKGWLPTKSAESGFAHYYVSSDGTYQAESDMNKAWHCANSIGNRDYIGIEVCQQYGDTETFKKNEQKSFKLAAKLCKKYNIAVTVANFPLHQELSSTSCPAESLVLHGKTRQALKEYIVSQVKKYIEDSSSTTANNTGSTATVSTNSFNINNYHTKKFSQIKLVKNDYAYKEVALKNKSEKVNKGTILTVTDLVYSGKYPRFKLKSGLYITTRKDTVEEYQKGKTTSATSANVQLKGSSLPSKGTYKFTSTTNIRSAARTTSSIVGTYNKGQTVAYDSKKTAGGYVWLSYIGNSGQRRYVAVV